MNMNDMFVKDMFCIDCNNANDIELSRLRSITLSTSIKVEVDWNSPMPSSWLFLEYKMMQKRSKGTRVMTFQEIKSLNGDNTLSLKSDKEITLFLKVHHEIGNFMHYADEGLKELIILDAQWLIDSFKSIITSSAFRKASQFKKGWDMLHACGILYTDFIENVWKNDTVNRFYEFQDKLILLLERLDLISSPRCYDDLGGHVIVPYFVVPCMLSTMQSHFVSIHRNKALAWTFPLAFEFIHHFLPSATVHRLFATCILRYPHIEGEVYCDAEIFKVDEQHNMILQFTVQRIIVEVVNISRTTTDSEICQGVREFLLDTLKSIVFAQRKLLTFETKLSCSKYEPYAWLNWPRRIVGNYFARLACEGNKY